MKVKVKQSLNKFTSHSFFASRLLAEARLGIGLLDARLGPPILWGPQTWWDRNFWSTQEKPEDWEMADLRKKVSKNFNTLTHSENFWSCSREGGKNKRIPILSLKKSFPLHTRNCFAAWSRGLPEIEPRTLCGVNLLYIYLLDQCGICLGRVGIELWLRLSTPPTDTKKSEPGGGSSSNPPSLTGKKL